MKQLQESGTPTLQYSNTPTSGWFGKISYLLLAFLPVIILTKELSARKFPGRFIYPDYFGLFKFLFHLQEALLVGLVVALAGMLVARITNRWLRFAIYCPIWLWVIWLCVWAMVRARFMMQLSPRYVISLLVQPSAITGVGLQPSFFYTVVGTSFAIIFAMAIVGAFLSRRVGTQYAGRVALLSLGIFVLVHVPVRAYVALHINRGQYAVLALDDWSPITLRSEYLFPGLRARRPTLPNLENGARTQAYVEWAKNRPLAEIPRKVDIVWIVIEAFRADAISEKATPYLWSHADEFQLKLDRNHWSGGNASQFGLFSMFTGLSGYHLQTFIRERVRMPFFSFLEKNGYRTRIAQRSYFKFANFSLLLPASIASGRARAVNADDSDARMIDALLEDMNSRPSGFATDIVTFNATHWPFLYPAEDNIFQPAGAISRGHFTRTAAEAAEAHNRFRNSCHFVDRQIGRILEFLRERGALDRTLIIITGDHGEEFMERGQVFHTGAMNDYQGRPVLWMRFPDHAIGPVTSEELTSHIDILPTLLDFMGFDEDVLRTQGQSLLHPRTRRSALLVSEQGYNIPFYNALVTKDYITRWRNTPPRASSFSGVERRDGRRVVGEEWLSEAKVAYPIAAHEYEILPDPAAPLSQWRDEIGD